MAVDIDDDDGLLEDEICETCDDSGEVECGECGGSCVDLEGEDCIVCGGEGVTACPECG